MSTNLMKRTLSLLLALVLLAGNVPVTAFATEVTAEETVAETVAETAAPTAAATEEVQETTAPTETATEPASEETEAPTQPETVPAETFAPTEAVTEPAEETEAPALPTEPIPETEAVPETLPAPDVEMVKLPIMINPLYEGIFSADDFPAREPVPDDLVGSYQLLDSSKYLTVAEAAKVLRKHMVNRNETFTLYFKASSKAYGTHLEKMLLAAIEHTGDPKEGDFLQWHFASWGGTIEYFQDSGAYHFTFNAEVYYTTTAAQEKELDKAVTNLIDKLGIRNQSEYQKVKAVYDYICQNVTYDRVHLQDEEYLLKYSAYAALVNKTAVAEGYATLLYRILLELGMDTRVIAGLDADGSAHVWNITKIGDVYYNLDATMDSRNDVHAYFLRNAVNFLDHYRYSEYDTTQFHQAYPMAEEDCVEGVPGVPSQYFIIGMCGDELLFAIDREKNLVIAGTGPMWDFTSIADSNKDNCPPWYYWMDAFENVVIDEGVTTIGTYAFERMSDITSVTLPDTLVEIRKSAFQSLNKMKTIVLPANLESVGDFAFASCTQLTEITIPDSVKKIGNDAFSYCRSLSSVTFGKNLKSIGDEAFSYCDVLTEAILPEGLLTVGASAFSNCTQLKEVSLGKSLQSIGPKAFYYCRKVTEIFLPETLIDIGQQAFYRCGITEIVIPDSVATMGSEVFRGNSYLESVQWNKTLTNIPSGTFWECLNLTKFDIPANVTRIQYYAFASTGLKEIIIPDTVQYVGDSVFVGCGALRYAKLSNQLTSISSELFASSGLSSIEIPSSVKTIHSKAFARSRLNTINIPDSVTWIGDEAFIKCEQLESVVLPEGLYGMGASAFAYCSKLTEVTLPDSLESLGQSAFYACTGLTEIVIPNKIYAISDSAFGFCKALTSISLPESVGKIGNSAFYSCVSLNGITIPASVESIGDYAFRDCAGLKEIVFLGDAPQFGRYLFDNVTATAYYPYGNETWTADVLRNYEGTITWRARCLEHEYSSVEVVAPTCTENGYTRHSCPICKDSYYTDEIPLLGHDLSDWILDKEETCTTDGSRHKVCSRCDYTETEVLPRTGHTEVIDAYRAPTCTEIGFTEGSHCSTCSATIIVQEEIPALGHDMGQWGVFVEPACAEDGEERKDCSRCDHFETKAIPAPGHAVQTDAAVAPTCIEAGLTEGSHCAVCNEILVAQEVIPALGHDFAPAEDGIACRTCGSSVTVRFPQDYILLKAGESQKLEIEASSEELLNAVEWSIEGEEGIISMEQDGTVTARSVGTVHVVAELTYDDFTLSARCRVDVTDSAQIDGVQLSGQKVTTELFSTNYAGFEVLLQLPQNYSFMAEGIDVEAEHKGIAIEKAVFADPATAEMFDILVLDDRHVQIIPTDYAVNNPKLVKGTYKSAVTVTVLGQEHTSEVLTLTVKKTMPKLTASVAAFNSFYSGQTRQIVIKNATPISIMATSVPSWLKLAADGSGVLTLREDAPLKNASGKVSLQVETEEWRIPATVNLTVKNTYKARGLKLSATSVTAAANSNGIALKLVCTGKKDTFAGLNVTGMKAPAGYQVKNFSLADGSFLLTSVNGFVNETVKLEVTFSDTDVTQTLNLKIKTANITLTPSAKTVTLNKTVGDSAVISFTANPKDYKLEDLDIRLTTSKGVDKLNSGELEISENGNQLIIRTTETTPDKESYKLYVRAGGSKETVVTVNVVSAEPTVTLKATGSVDLSFPNQSATVTPTFKNCSDNYTEYSYEVEELKGKTVVDDAVKSKFDVQRDGKTLKITCVDEDINTSNSYRFTFKLTLEDGRTVSNTVTLKVKRTAVKLKLSAAKLTLNKLANDKGIVTVTCTTKNYDFKKPVVTVKDGGNNDATNQLHISYADNKLSVATNENTVFGATYKISLQADRYAPASVLTVTIPTEAKSNITATVKVSGKIDIIRDSSSVTVTPTYKNRALAEPVETLYVYNAAGEDVSHLFTVTPNGKGGLTVTKAENTSLPTGTYKVKLLADFGGTKAETKLVNMTVTMGSAKLTVKTESTTLFANDKQDRVQVWFEAADKTLNGVKKIEIKDAKYQDIFEVYDYENGTFGIGFKGDVPKDLAGKTVTLNLNVYLKGNETAKPNTTAKVKLTIVK